MRWTGAAVSGGGILRGGAYACCWRSGSSVFQQDLVELSQLLTRSRQKLLPRKPQYMTLQWQGWHLLVLHQAAKQNGPPLLHWVWFTYGFQSTTPLSFHFKPVMKCLDLFSRKMRLPEIHRYEDLWDNPIILLYQLLGAIYILLTLFI